MVLAIFIVVYFLQHSIIRWWSLNGEKQYVFKDKIIKKEKWEPYEDVDKIWNEMTTCIKRESKEELGESEGCGWATKETWWWK